MPSDEIIKVNSDTATCDLKVNRMDKSKPSILFENKDYSRSVTTDEIKKFDLALLPYPESPYYDRSFPIKVIEMAAAGVPMLASNTKAHRRLLGLDNQLLFQPGSELSLKQVINFLLENPKILNEERIRLLSWSSKHTYRNKVKKILEMRPVI